MLFRSVLETAYRMMRSISIDYGVMEKAHDVFVIKGNFGWSDVGSWNALYEIRTPDGDGNVILSGNVKSQKSKACLVQVPEGKKVALVGVTNLIIVEKDGILLIADRDQDQLVKQISGEFSS